MTTQNNRPSVGTGESAKSDEKWLVAYYYGVSDTPLHYLGTSDRPALFSQQDARNEAARLNAEIINSVQEEAFDGDLQIWRYAAVPMQFCLKGGQFDGEVSVSATPPSQTARTAQGVYEEYAERCGRDAADHAVMAYLDRVAIVEILLEHIDADSLDKFLRDSLADRQALQPNEQQIDDFLRELDDYPPDDEEPSGDRVNWQKEGF